MLEVCCQSSPVLATYRIMDSDSAAAAGKSMVEWRGEILNEICRESLSTITPMKCISWHTHMIKMLARANKLEDI